MAIDAFSNLLSKNANFGTYFSDLNSPKNGPIISKLQALLDAQNKEAAAIASGEIQTSQSSTKNAPANA